MENFIPIRDSRGRDVNISQATVRTEGILADFPRNHPSQMVVIGAGINTKQRKKQSFGRSIVVANFPRLS
jgi:hypothetical protein